MPGHVALTPAEREVLLRTLDGASAHDIAQARERSLHTVRTQIASIHRKLDVQTTTQAVVWAIAHATCCLGRAPEPVDAAPDEAT